MNELFERNLIQSPDTTSLVNDSIKRTLLEIQAIRNTLVNAKLRIQNQEETLPDLELSDKVLDKLDIKNISPSQRLRSLINSSHNN